MGAPKMQALPQAVTVENGWRVEYAPPVPGFCRTDKKTRTMYAPDDDTYTAAAIRAHEMAHAAFSPIMTAAEIAPEFGATVEALTVAEEWRVNAICTSTGVSMAHLIDGTEGAIAKKIAASFDYRAALLLTATVWGTNAEGTVKRALQKHAPKEWRANLRSLKKYLDRYARHHRLSSLEEWKLRNEIENTERVYPLGFSVAVEIARVLDNMAANDPTPTPEQRAAQRRAEKEAEAEAQRQSRKKGAKYRHLPEFTGEGSKYDDVRLLDIEHELEHRGKLAKRRTPSNVGKKPRRMSRLLTDPQRRVFDNRRRANGGVVLVDQSGSMSLTVEEIDAMLEAAGGAVVIGYSNGNNDEANVWVIAQNGKRATNYPDAGWNNGVDASAIRYAASRLTKKGEPFIWVTDGRAYSLTGFARAEAVEIHDLCAKHRIHVAPTPADAIRELQRTARGNAPLPRFSRWAESEYRAYIDGTR